MLKNSQKAKSKSIKAKLLIVPLICVLVGILMIGAISSYLTRDSLLAEMRENGFSSSQRFVNRIEDSTEAVKTMNEMMESQIRSVGNIVIGNRSSINDVYLTQLAAQTGMEHLYWYNAAGEIINAANGEYLGWKAEPGDPINNFMISGAPELMEEIRKGTELDENYKFGYMKSSTGEFVQAGVSADRVLELTEKFGYQALIDELVSDENIVYATFIDHDLIGVADSNKDNIGKNYQDDENIKKVALDGEMSAKEYFYEAEKTNVYDVLYPVVLNGELKGAFNIGYSMSTVQAAITENILLIALAGLLVFLVLGFILYKLSTSITKPIVSINHMIKEMRKGHLGIRLNLDSQDEIGEMAMIMDAFADDLQMVVIGTMNQISAGDVSADLEDKDALDEITPALKRTIKTIRDLIQEATRLSQAAVAGKLETRGNAEAFAGGFRDIVEGVNATLDAVVGPLNIAAEYVNKIGQGEIPDKINKSYQGDFDKLKQSINACIDGLGALKEGNRILALMSKNDLSQKIENQYMGIYGEIGDEINSVHDQLVRIVMIANHIEAGELRDLNELKVIGKRSENDTLIPSLIGMMENIVLLVEETQKMTITAVTGDLSFRGDQTRFPGEYAKVIAGFNQTLDAVIQPINEASETLKELAAGNLNTQMDGDYQGDHAIIKEAMNQTITNLKRYVEEITRTLEEISRGNLDQEITTAYMGDFQAIKEALNGISSSLSITMSDIDVASAHVEIGARQISDGGQALAQGTTEQASSIQELTASIEEVAGETKQNAVRANDANELAVRVRKNAEVGNGQMAKMIAAMGDIDDSSNNISKIIKVIDDIAFQTNILALNAAVEAARAGQHGKGFAVVAEEVRTLAARSAEAAKETTGLIEGSIEKVGIGTKIADETAESLKEILTEIEKVTSLVGNIARASTDQASEIAQITQGIEQVSQVVQTNSATAEESAAASEELSGQAEMLKVMVGAFKLKDQSNQKKEIVIGKKEFFSQSQIILNELESVYF
ncbi:MAG: methyl-accepting chemotaxis protein [Acetobacterium sp.]|nr:HAMP domain-containing protein [Bacillota bacterium]MCG2731368.1 methyl-accepting chemotaxis protein [Acetobacterium sp.]